MNPLQSKTENELLSRLYIIFLLFALSSLVLLPSATNASAPEKEKPVAKTAAVEPIGHWAFSRLNKAQEALADEKYDAAVEELKDLKRNKRLNSHERAMMWQIYGYLEAARGNHKESAAAFEECLAQDGLTDRQEQSIINNLAQIYLMLGDYAEAIGYFEKWFDVTESPNAEAHHMFALALTHSEQTDRAVAHAEAAIDKSSRPNEGRLQLLSAIYFRQDRIKDLVPILRQLVTHFPKKNYWMQLAAVYSQLERFEDALAVQETAYEQGLLTEKNEYLTLARLFLHGDIPYEAARVLEEGLNKGTLSHDEEAYDLLASSYLRAREFNKAIEPLEKAAAMAPTGATYVRLGEVHMTRARWDIARDAFYAALDKGDLKERGNVYLLLGIANANASRFDAAKRAFNKATQFEKSRKAAAKWGEYVEQQLLLQQAMSQTAELNESTKSNTSASAEPTDEPKTDAGTRSTEPDGVETTERRSDGEMSHTDPNEDRPVRLAKNRN